MTAPRVTVSDRWLERTGPRDHVVISSRARYARNIPGVPFPMRAKQEELLTVVDSVANSVARLPSFRGGHAFYLHEMPAVQRHFLKENHLISAELEKGGVGSVFLVSADVRCAVMVNEEDHLRLFCLEPGYQPRRVLESLYEIETQLHRELQFAFNPRYGYLTACPTNTGTGLRISTMLHLPALSALKKIPEIVKSLPPMGLVVRGFHGENSELLGDYCQVSNEVTLGISEEEIADRLTKVVDEIVAREEQARQFLIEQNRLATEDEAYRAFGILTHARSITSNESLSLLSKLRFGIDQRWFGRLSHGELNRLSVEVQPAHIALTRIVDGEDSTEYRDRLRADMLRQRLADLRH